MMDFSLFWEFICEIGQGVAHYAHIGGAITGFNYGMVLEKNQFNDNRWNSKVPFKNSIL
jgi:membrane associated rhomboid family serine protease